MLERHLYSYSLRKSAKAVSANQHYKGGPVESSTCLRRKAFMISEWGGVTFG